MINPATGWFKMRVKNNILTLIANLVEQTWLMRYPWPSQIIYGKGTDFMGKFTDLIQKDYRIKCRDASVGQSNAVLERIH